MDIFLNQARSFEEKGKLNEAIESYRLCLERNPNQAGWCNCKIGQIKAYQGKLEQAIFSYRQGVKIQPQQPAWVYVSFADALKKNGQMEEAIAAYQQAIKIKPDNSIVYLSLANTMMAQKDVRGAIYSYRKGIEIQPQQPVWVYITLADALQHNEQMAEAIAIYQQAAQLYPDTERIYEKLVNLLRSQGHKKEAAKWIKQHPQVKQKEIYSKIWQALNQSSLQALAEENINYPTVFERQEVQQYFRLSSHYETIKLNSLSNEDLKFLSSHNISINNIKYIAKSSNYNAKEQEICLKHFNPEFEGALKTFTKQSKYLLYPFLNSMLETGYIYAICPISGEYLRSDQAFILVDRYVGVLYRFIGEEVFYLLAGWIPGGQFQVSAVYFPSSDIIVETNNNPYMNLVPSFNVFKAWLVSHWQLAEKSINYKAENPKELMYAVEFHFNIGHNLVNDLSGIEVLLQAGLIDKIDKFFVGDHEYFGRLELLYPEIPPSKIIRLKNQDDSNEEVTTIALENNYLPLSIRGRWVSEDLASRIYRVSQQKCSQSFLTMVQDAQKHFPLIWISFRIHNRSWISQIEGIANIIADLATDFPNLGAVFDGFSFADCHLEKDDELVNRKQDIVQQENAIVTQILDLLAAKNINIGVYNMIGCMMHESIVWAYAVDFYIASMGAGLSKVALLANKPGIQHSCTAYMKDFKHWYNTDFRENAVNPITISEDFIIDRDPADWYCSYDCDWRVIYDEAMKVALNLSKK